MVANHLIDLRTANKVGACRLSQAAGQSHAWRRRTPPKAQFDPIAHSGFALGRMRQRLDHGQFFFRHSQSMWHKG
jgi:hypothetical protein